jgi:hypothetical protein
MNKMYQRPVMIDDRNSEEMKNIFLRWANEPEKYGVKNYFVYDAKTKKTLIDSTELEHEVWISGEQGRRYTVIFDFIGVLKEAEKSGPMPEKLTYSGPNVSPPDRTFR